MPSQFFGALIAVALGIWAYTDAKNLGARNIKVGRFPPLAWGFAVALFAIVFGVLYLVQRRRAVQTAASPSLPSLEGAWSPPPPPPFPNAPAADAPPARDPTDRDRFCRSCGHELPAYVSSFCPKCGRSL